jgi:hypothetical protein
MWAHRHLSPRSRDRRAHRRAPQDARAWGCSVMVNLHDARLPERFWKKVTPEPSTGCWLWTGSTTESGYGYFRLDGKARRAHRVAFTRLVAEIPDGLELDHGCRVRCCVNPAHLTPMTHKENCRRSPIIMRRHAKDSCPHGHPFTEENTMERRTRVGRECRTCINARSRNRKRRVA